MIQFLCLQDALLLYENKRGIFLINIAICDSNDLQREHIAALADIILSKCSVEHKIFSFANGKEMSDFVFTRGNVCDIVFLGIDSDSENRLELSLRFTDAFPDAQVILVSAYAENARNICAVKYADFLVEPINADDLQLVLIRALQNVIKAQPAYITLSYDNAVTVLNTNEIKYCESNGRKLIFHTLSGTYTAYIKISEATDKLPPNFVRLHKSFVVNFDYIAAIYPYAARLRDGTEISSPQKKYKTVKEMFISYADAG